MTEEQIRAAAARLAAAGDSRPRAARDPVNLPMVRSWVEALGGGPVPEDTVPPAMIQVWTMPGLHGARTDDDPLGQMNRVLDEAGYTSVVATNCDQAYHRHLKLGAASATTSQAPSGLPDADRGHRRHRSDRVLQGLRPQRAPACRRGGAGRA